MSQYLNLRLFLVPLFTSFVLLGCGKSNSSIQEPSLPVVSVGVAEVVNMNLTEWDEFSGRLSSPESVTLIPRVSGYVETIMFEEGAMVQQGNVLLLIDPEPFAVEVERLQAQLDSANSRLHLAEVELKRGEKLIKQKAISSEELDARFANVQQSRANVLASNASLKRAQLDLSYTRVKAPISGKISTAKITQGNFVTAGVSALTSIHSTEWMYAHFNIDEQTYLKYLRSGLLQANKKLMLPVVMSLSGETEFSYQGQLDFIDNQVNQSTGSITVRARFENSDNTLLQGLFAHIRIAGSQAYDGILIDEKAVGTDLNNKYVLVVDQNNTIEYRPIVLGESLGELRIVTAGLSAGDQIVINGLQRVMPNMTIDPKIQPMVDNQTIAAIVYQQNQLKSNEIAVNKSVWR